MLNDDAYGRTVVDRDDFRGVDWPVVTDEQFRRLLADDVRSKPVCRVCDDFRTVTAYATDNGLPFADAAFDGFRERLADVAPAMTDDQLIAVFKLVSLWNVQDANNPKYKELWSAFDALCIRRYRYWNTDKLLLCMDHWYTMNLSMYSKFVMLGVKTLAGRPSR